MSRARQVLFVLFLAAAAVTLVIGITSMWFVIGFGDYATLSTGTLTAYSEPIRLSDFDIYPLNPQYRWPRRLSSAFSLPAVVRPVGGRVVFIDLPLWMFAIAFGGGAFLTKRKRPAKPGCCECGYNLTSNVSGRCPECDRYVPNS